MILMAGKLQLNTEGTGASWTGETKVEWDRVQKIYKRQRSQIIVGGESQQYKMTLWV